MHNDFDDVRVGIFCCLAATFLFWMVAIIGKILAETYPILLLVFFRSAFALLMCVVFASQLGGLTALKAQNPAALILRGIIWLVTLSCSFAAYHMLPVADAAAIEYAGPLFITVLATLLLGEIVGVRHWIAISVGFVGVLLIIRPGFNTFHHGILFALGNAFFYALGSLLVRQLSRTENSITIVFYSCLVAATASAALLPFFWVVPTLKDLGLLCLMGMLGMSAQYLVTQSFRYAPASTVSPFTYSGLIWAILFGFLIWSELPDMLDLAGVFTILISGLYLARLKNAGTPRLVRPRLTTKSRSRHFGMWRNMRRAWLGL